MYKYMDNFFFKKKLSIEDEAGNSIDLTIHPLKVKDLPEMIRIDEMDEEEWTAAIIDMIGKRSDREIESLPLDALKGIIDEFMELNFGKDEPTDKKKTDPKISFIDSITITFDFLIWQGHNFSEILEYELPLFFKLRDTAIERVFGKQKMDPLEAFKKMGIPIKHKTKN